MTDTEYRVAMALWLIAVGRRHPPPLPVHPRWVAQRRCHYLGKTVAWNARPASTEHPR